MGISDSVITEFETVLGAENVLRGEADRQSYAYDSSLSGMARPGLVLIPRTVEQLGVIVRIAYQNGAPITVRGAGTCLSGGAVPVADTGIVIATTELNRILELNPRNGYAVVEPGVRTADFVREVEKAGLFYPPDPGSMAVCTMGGNIAENSSGARGLKYGTVGKYVLGLEFFDYEGNLITTGARTLKCTAGYDLTPLVVGSEGTLGVLARATLRLIPRPAASKTVLAFFADPKTVCMTGEDILALGIVPARMEFMDTAMSCDLKVISNAGCNSNAVSLLIELDGAAEQTERDAGEVVRCCQKRQAQWVWSVENTAEAATLWKAWESALRSITGEKSFILEDVMVPRTAIPEFLDAIRGIGDKYALDIHVFGHLGDGNIHPVLLFDRHDEGWSESLCGARKALGETALSLKGTLSGEYGTGSVKAPWLEKALSPATIALYKSIKRVMDPKGLFNPGKIIPE